LEWKIVLNKHFSNSYTKLGRKLLERWKCDSGRKFGSGKCVARSREFDHSVFDSHW